MSEDIAPMTAATEGTLSDGLVPDQDQPFAKRAINRALQVAWLAVFAGISVQILVLVARMAAGGGFPGAQFVASLAQGISWSVLVCGAVAIGTVAARARSAITGLIGLIAGPLSWGLAKGVQKGVQSLLAVQQDPITSFFFKVSAIKGLEYAVLGAALGYMVGKKWANVWAHVALGMAVGTSFAAIVVPMSIAKAASAGAPLPGPAVASMTMNEFVFPIGCALVIYAVQRMRKHVEAVA